MTIFDMLKFLTERTHVLCEWRETRCVQVIVVVGVCAPYTREIVSAQESLVGRLMTHEALRVYTHCFHHPAGISRQQYLGQLTGDCRA